MAYTTINKSTDYFNTKLYTGNNSTNAITGVGHQPDMVWIKRRNNTADHQVYDSVRGVQKGIFPSTTGAEATEGSTRGLNAFNSDGFTLGAEVSDIAGSCNANSDTYASWNWKANGTGSANTDGTISSTVSANTTSGFSIVKWTGNGSSGATVGHGLGVAPKIVLIKTTSGADAWTMLNTNIDLNKYLALNSTAAAISDPMFNNTAPSSTVFTLDSDGQVNGSGVSLIAYCFAEKTGYSKFGSFSGNNNNDGSFIYTGFAPSFVMVKRSSDIQGWVMWDNKRPGYNKTNQSLTANENSAEETGRTFDILSNGFKMRDTNTATNAASTYIYMAFGQTLVGSNNIPCTAR